MDTFNAESETSSLDEENLISKILQEEIAARQNRQEELNNDENYVETEPDFDEILANIFERLKVLYAPIHGKSPAEGDIENTPKVSNVKDVVQEIKTKSHIVVLTGAGQSVASNIPTFRGEGGYWTLRNENEKISASKFLTHKYFCNGPEEIWRWHHEFRILVEKNKPNVSHHALADLQMFYKKQNKKFTLITQNIDGYHVDAYRHALERSQLAKPNSVIKSTGSFRNIRSISKASSLKYRTPTPNSKKIYEIAQIKKFGFCDEVYELHGSINYMRCDKSCTSDLFPGPKVGCADDFVPECPKCKGVARPHTLFFDEGYEQEYYRKDTILNEIQTSDCLIVIGTALETNLAASIVGKAIKNKNLIIEINPQPCIKNGNVRHLIGGVEEILPELAQALQN